MKRTIRKPLMLMAAGLTLLAATAGGLVLERQKAGRAARTVAAADGSASRAPVPVISGRPGAAKLLAPPAHLEAEAPSPFGGPAVDREQLGAARRLRAERLAERFDGLLSKEAPDPGFQSELEAQVRSMTALPALKGARLEQLQCGATLCRAMVLFDSPEAQRRVQPVLQGAGRLTGGGDAFVRTLDDPLTPRAQVYFSRERPLPYAEALDPGQGDPG
jgi:hypothetical protein